ncbi:Uncharacterised protein [Actinobacillus suis]|nr:Uncharacterised protein [Actinobacillus suis]
MRRGVIDRDAIKQTLEHTKLFSVLCVFCGYKA